MTVGSPPSMTATTLFVVPRSMPMILPMRGALLVVRVRGQWGGQVVGWLSWPGPRRPVPRGRDRDEGGPDDAVAEPVAAPDLVDDLALRAAGAGDAHDGLVLAGVEGGPGRRVDGGHALALEQQPELAVDGGDALGPGAVGELGGAHLDGPVEVVGEVEDLA